MRREEEDRLAIIGLLAVATEMVMLTMASVYFQLLADKQPLWWLAYAINAGLILSSYPVAVVDNPVWNRSFILTTAMVLLADTIVIVCKIKIFCGVIF